MEEIVKLGYKRLTFVLLDRIYLRFHNYDVSLEKEKEKLRKKAKEEYVFYYSKSALLKEHIYEWEYIDFDSIQQESYKIVKIPKKELEMILLKNQLCGCLTVNIIQEKEFDKIFDELYPRLMAKRG